MDNKNDKPEPTAADDRLMDALLREHSRLGSRAYSQTKIFEH